jgi:hypothetical protein
LIALDDPLGGLARSHPRQAGVVEFRWPQCREAAEALQVHPNTVINDRNFAKTWLARERQHRKDRSKLVE